MAEHFILRLTFRLRLSNKMKKLPLFLSVFLSIASFSCEKVSDEPAFEETPRIELATVSQDTLVEFQDQLVLTINYEDGDGDLGNPDPDINSIFVKDSRLEAADEYYLGPLAPEGSSVSIQGTLNLELSTTFLLGNGSEENTIFTIYVVDRKGNQSNSIETPNITILRD